MTLDMFMSELKQHKITLQLSEGGRWIRTPDGMCPICALHHARTGDRYSNGMYYGLAIQMGLKLDDITKIIVAADGLQEMDGLDASHVRNQLLAMTNFGEP